MAVLDGGFNCRSGGRLTAMGGGGTGFEAQYSPGVYRVTDVVVVRAGVGCGTGARQPLTVTVAGGAVTGLSFTGGSGSGYLSGRWACASRGRSELEKRETERLKSSQ